MEVEFLCPFICFYSDFVMLWVFHCLIGEDLVFLFTCHGYISIRPTLYIVIYNKGYTHFPLLTRDKENTSICFEGIPGKRV